MPINDPIGDLLTRIRNAQMRRRSSLSAPASTLRMRVLEVLVDEGYIRGYTKVDHADGKSEIQVELKYNEGQPAIREIKRISKPGRRVYSAVRDIPTVANGLGVAILSTPKGVLADWRAREENVGGEVLCSVF
ncbi:MAG: 30S ribosomal protein S8 [Pseudomonadota bacterium]